MELISETTTTEYDKKYAVIYKDKGIDIEEYCENGKNNISYNFHDNKPVEHQVWPDDNASFFTAAYFGYINKYKSIPTFTISPEGKHGFSFKMLDENGNNYTMDFVAEINQKNTHCLNLEEFGVYVFENEAMDKNPYDMDMYILLEIHFSEKRDRLLIIDHDQNEFYAVNIYYQQVLSGKTYMGDIKSYIQDGEKYTFFYDDKGELDRIDTFSGDTVAYIEKDANHCNITHRIPYTKTSYGVIISDPDHVLYQSRYRQTEKDDQEIETTIRLLTKEESESFIEKI